MLVQAPDGVQHRLEPRPRQRAVELVGERLEVHVGGVEVAVDVGEHLRVMKPLVTNTFLSPASVASRAQSRAYS